MIEARMRSVIGERLPRLFGSPDEGPPRHVDSDQVTPAKSARTCRILVVDDEDTFRYSLVLELTVRYEADVQWARYGTDAIARATASAGMLDLILLDVALIGEVDGVAVHDAIRAAGIDTPVIFMSAYYDEDTRKKIASTGAPMFKKPGIDYKKIEAVLGKCRRDAS